MGRHSLPDDSAPRTTGSPRARRRALVPATVVVVAAGSVVALRGGLPFGTPCDGDSVRLKVVASPDMAPALNAVAERAREDGVRTDGKCLDVTVNAQPSSEVADSLAQRPADPEFQVWVPDSDLWVDRVTDERGSSLTAVSTLASSPIALGALHRAAETLGWPGRRYSWGTLTRAATTGGALRLGVADPTRSATGLLALARIVAADHKEAGSDDEAAARTAATAKLLYERTTEGDAQALATLPRDDSGAERGNPRRNQALFLSEQAAYAHNTTEDGGPALDLFYPTDGTAQLTYPYTLVDEDSLTADESRAANRFMTLLDDTPGQRTLRDHGFRAGDGRADARLAGKAGTHRDELSAALGALPPVRRGATGLYDTTRAAYRRASATYPSGRFNALVIVTDGADAGPAGIGLDALVTALQRLTAPERPVPLIAIGIGPRTDRAALDRIVAPTGGSAHQVDDPSRIHEVILKAIMAAGRHGPR
ncbi:substrate-binding and VWA domain-containing protein [Streptomyces sp. BHT-5-2]|uniref:substrate-binding and VWA domain-containing protein n=1 Tax=Streptomyces sp. BHT-5-2 TaxID=2866715 RepID=UPI001C8D3658|nr:substrate-binding and VWA domain-containing protein [Streptomyces sp. BHT-5-2]QZL05459.1 substrate-binding and VWA domain-containing protein [Streptomyces sp. BHT-5-2]